jgi:hypothetical protein
MISAEVDDLGNQVNALAGLLNVELRASVGAPGEAGNELAILNVCNVFTEACVRVLEWEESVRFCSPPRGLEKVKALLVGLGGRNIERIFESNEFAGLNEVALKPRNHGGYLASER